MVTYHVYCTFKDSNNQSVSFDGILEFREGICADQYMEIKARIRSLIEDRGITLNQTNDNLTLKSLSRL